MAKPYRCSRHAPPEQTHLTPWIRPRNGDATWIHSFCRMEALELRLQCSADTLSDAAILNAIFPPTPPKQTASPLPSRVTGTRASSRATARQAHRFRSTRAAAPLVAASIASAPMTNTLTLLVDVVATAQNDIPGIER